MLKFSKKRKILLIVFIMVIVITIFFIFFLKNDDKNLKFGNTKSIKDIEEYILNISSYEAEVTVIVNSNKNQNKYVLKQSYKSPNISNQIVIEPENIAGLETTYDGVNLKIFNSKLNLTKLYENYKNLTDNYLCLETFIKDYKKSAENNFNKLYEENNEIVFECKTQTENMYKQNKQLYVDKITGKPTKMLIQDINENTIVYILYNEITINT